MCLCCLHGQVIMGSDEEPVLVLRAYKWGVLVWPLVRVEDGRTTRFHLNEDGSVTWIFIDDPSQWNAFKVAVTWWERGVCLTACGLEEPLIKNSLRRASDFTFENLTVIARHLGIERPSQSSRYDLLEKMATLLNSGSSAEEGYVEEVLSSDKSVSKKLKAQEFLEAIMTEMDPDERREFRDIEEGIEKEKKAAVQNRWKSYHDEKVADDKASKLTINNLSV